MKILVEILSPLLTIYPHKRGIVMTIHIHNPISSRNGIILISGNYLMRVTVRVWVE